MSVEAPRILVVDDELGIREGCRKILEPEGYVVETAADGATGLKLFKERGDFAGALIDLKMPRMGGIELIEKIREEDDDIALLVITAYATIQTAVEATKRGAYAYVPKPFTPDELLLPVKHGLEKRALTIEARRLGEERQNRLLEVAFERSKSTTIIECISDAVLVVNCARQIVLRNTAAARIIPQCAEFRSPIPSSALGQAELTDVLSEALEAHAGPVIASREITIGERTYMVNASPVVEPDAGTLGAVAVLRDITPLKELAAAKSMFVSMVAHEVKSPLAVIEGYLNAILSGAAAKGPQSERNMIHTAQVHAKTLRTMVSELLDLSVIETGNFIITRSPLDITEVVAAAVESCTEKAGEKNIELSLSHQEAAVHQKVLADRDAMLSVFTNLIDNAIKYTPSNGHVGVRVDPSEFHVRVVVQDDGIGMTPDEKNNVFDEFFRVRNEYTTRVPGTGLGLTLVKRLVEMHQGKITVQTAPGKGSSFVVSLPTADQASGK